jgi:hypothetical protein
MRRDATGQAQARVNARTHGSRRCKHGRWPVCETGSWSPSVSKLAVDGWNVRVVPGGLAGAMGVVTKEEAFVGVEGAATAPGAN